MPAKQELDVFIHDMLAMSAFCYHFHSIRTIVRSKDNTTVKTGFLGFGKPREIKFFRPELIITRNAGIDRDPNQQLLHDITPAAIQEFIENNRSLFQDDDMDGSLEFDPSDTKKDEPFLVEGALKEQMEDNLKIIDYDDRFSTDKGGLVYMIVTNLTQKTITVCFRGTIGTTDMHTDRDFRLNTEAFFGSEDDFSVPKSESHNPATHNGFTTYLTSNRETDSIERPYAQRILACLNAEFGNNKDIKGKGFKLFVTGHSLGGGLANLFAFRAAQLKARGDKAVEHLPDMIKALTFAAPCVGNEGYEAEFQALEKKGFLRHIRVANEEDVVPTNCISLPFSLAIKGDTSLYRQNGVNLQFHPDKTCDIVYGNTKSMLSQFSPTRSLNTHYLTEYRVRVGKPENESVYNQTIEDIYKEATNNFAA